MPRQKTITYTNELTDEFSYAKIKTKYIGKDYVYYRDSAFSKFSHFLWYRIIMTPIAYAYLKLKFRHRIINGEILESNKDQAFFLYGNHTQSIADAFIPTFVAMPKHCYCIVHPNNVSIPVLGKITPSLGALPLPSDLPAMRNFLNAIKKRVQENNAIVIYPEAHIWPYSTTIRPFPDDSFHYPVITDKPVYCFTNTYQKGSFGKVVIVTYVDGPFYPDKDLDKKDAMKKLRDQVYEAMTREARKNTVEVIHYERKS